jgi:hypothetical protein
MTCRRCLGWTCGSKESNSHSQPLAHFPTVAFRIDLHAPDAGFQKGLEGEEFISRATEGKDYQYKGPYWAPYRCLYSRNITNLFMAGRDISVTHEALGPVRVMRTCGMMGEIIGEAAWICVSHETSPRGVDEKYLPLLKELMQEAGAMRRDKLDGRLAASLGTHSNTRSFGIRLQLSAKPILSIVP